MQRSAVFVSLVALSLHSTAVAFTISTNGNAFLRIPRSPTPARNSLALRANPQFVLAAPRGKVAKLRMQEQPTTETEQLAVPLTLLRVAAGILCVAFCAAHNFTRVSSTFFPEKGEILNLCDLLQDDSPWLRGRHWTRQEFPGYLSQSSDALWFLSIV